MGHLTLHDLDPALEQRLQTRAERRGSSVEAEILRILTDATAGGLGTEITERFNEIGLRPGETLERPSWDMFRTTPLEFED